MKYKTVLVCGLPGAGKTYFAAKLREELGDTVQHINGDGVRSIHNDWDFSEEGRLRQAQRMRRYADEENANGKHVILDFVCPKQEYRDIIKPDIIVWANRTPVRDFPDTTAMFENPNYWDYQINDDTDVESVIPELVQYYIHEPQLFSHTAPTALMIGRYQPWHDGHTALFKKALEKHGQVCIVIREMPYGDKNPFSLDEVCDRIDAALAEYKNKYIIRSLPNIVDVVYGREVGWTVTKFELPSEIEAISATKIREEMKK